MNSNLFNCDYNPSLLEQWGVRYFEYLGQKFGTNTLSNLKIDELPPDAVLQSLSSNITGFAAIVAFGIGAITTFVTIWFEWNFKTVLPVTEYYLWYSIILLCMIVIEFLVLFWLGLRTVYSLSSLTGQYQSNAAHLLPIEYSTSTILARSAMELPDPVVNYL